MAMTFVVGRRFVIVDGAERWSDADVDSTSLRRSPVSRPTRRLRSSPARTGARRRRPGWPRRSRRRGGDVAPDNAQGPRPAAVGDRRGDAARRDARRGGGAGARRARRRPPGRLLRELQETRDRARCGARIGSAKSGRGCRVEPRGWVSSTRWWRAMRRARRAFITLRVQGERCHGSSRSWSSAPATCWRSPCDSPTARRPRRSSRACG